MDSRILQLSHVIHLAIKYKMYLKFSKNFAAFVAFQNRPCPAPLTPRKKETGLNSSKDDFLTKSFSSSTKRKLRILFNFLFPFVSFNGVFSTSKAELWSWKPAHYNRAAAILLTHKRFTNVSKQPSKHIFLLPLKNHQIYAQRKDSDWSIRTKQISWEGNWEGGEELVFMRKMAGWA